MSSIQPSLSSKLYVSNIENIDSEYKLPIELWGLITQLFVHHVESNGKLGRVIAWAGVCKGTFVLCLKASQMLKTVFICKHLPSFSTLNASTREAKPPVLIQVANCSIENKPISPYQKVWPYSIDKYPLAIGPNGTNYYRIWLRLLTLYAVFIRTKNGVEKIINLEEKVKNYSESFAKKDTRNDLIFLNSLKPIACHPERDTFLIITEGWITIWKCNEEEPLLLDAFSPFKEPHDANTRLKWSAYYQGKLYLSATGYDVSNGPYVSNFILDLSSRKRTELEGIMHSDKLLVLKDQLCLMTRSGDNLRNECLQVTIQEEEQEIESQDQATEKGKKTVYVVNRGEKLFDFLGGFYPDGHTPIAPYWLLHIGNGMHILDTKKGCFHILDIPDDPVIGTPKSSIFVKNEFFCIFYGGPNFRIIHIPSKKDYTIFFKSILAPYLTRFETTVTMFDFRMVSSTEVYLDVNFLNYELHRCVTYKLTIPLAANNLFSFEDFSPPSEENSKKES